MYRKEIIYMGLFHNDIKEKNAGYLKVDKRENTYRLELQVKNLPGMIVGSFPIRLQSQTGWQEAADALVVKDGNGKWSGSAAEPILRAEVIVSDDRRIKGESRSAITEKRTEETTAKEMRAKETTAEETRAKERMAEETRAKGRMAEEARAKETTAEETRSKERTAEEATAKETTAEKTRAKERTTEEATARATTDRTMKPGENEEERDAAERKALQTEIGPKAGGRTLREGSQKELTVSDNKTESKAIIKAERPFVKRQEHTPLYENKWEQLLTTYEQIHPYGDNRIYVKLEPKDFIILRENYQHLVNNSFLLHGFYNYRYLILGKEREKEKEKGFYLGVPGVFYEREKMVALMFGFEAFECEGGEAEEGKFGYYLRKVEL